ncbi:MAG: SDR family oxidoreductase [DPANN group archaeon]|nr:SDR family oxidoreductase [DPANN group archaeon]
MAKYLVTGGAGFIGSNIVRELVKQKEEVIVIDNLLTGYIENISDIMDNINFIEEDIRDFDKIRPHFNGVDYVLHQAALPSVPKSLLDPIKSNDININGTLNVLEASKQAGVKRLVYAASSSAYGDTPTLPKREDMKISPLSPYAVSKVTGELYSKVYSNVFGLDTVSIRYFNVFGPRQDPNSAYAAVIPKFIKSMLKGVSPTVYGDGTQTRDFTFIKNVVNANILATKVKENLNGETINVACNERITLNELVNLLNKHLNTNIEPEYVDEKAGDIKHSLADISKAKQLIGYSPITFLEEGLKETIKWYN